MQLNIANSIVSCMIYMKSYSGQTAGQALSINYFRVHVTYALLVQRLGFFCKYCSSVDRILTGHTEQYYICLASNSLNFGSVVNSQFILSLFVSLIKISLC